MLAIDHVILGVRDLETAAARLLAEHGLASVAGGRHTGLGTANRVVPLGDDYLELLAVVDPAEAEANPLGQALAGLDEDHLVGWMVQTDDLDPIAARLEIEPFAMVRERPDGTVLRWRLAVAPPGSPFPTFIEWDIPDGAHPGRAPAPHTVVPAGISRVVVGGDPAELDRWLGPHDLPVSVAGGEPGLRAVHIATDTGEITIG